MNKGREAEEVLEIWRERDRIAREQIRRPARVYCWSRGHRADVPRG
jgi:hypothetical protein